MKIYTSYHNRFQKLIKNRILPVSISVQFPKFVEKRYPELRELAPTYAMLKMTQKDYDIQMDGILKKMDPDMVVEYLRTLVEKYKMRDVALLCFEKDHTVCHRSKVAEWLREAGHSCEEWEDRSNQLFLF